MTEGSVGAVLRDARRRLDAAGSETPGLDAQVLLSHVMEVRRIELIAHPERPVSSIERASFQDALERRLRGEPVAYIRGIKEFYGRSFMVDDRVLIPRPETEQLVETALEWLREQMGSMRRRTDPGRGRLIVRDVGTGSGAIIIALAATIESWLRPSAISFTASDRSAAAVEVASANARAHGLADRIGFFVADLLADPVGSPAELHVDPEAGPTALSADPIASSVEPIDLIVANLPYLASSILPALPVATHFEPQLALDGGPDGLMLVRRLLSQLPDRLATGGRALLEIGSDQGAPMRALVADLLPGWAIELRSDLAGRDRIVQLDRPAGS